MGKSRASKLNGYRSAVSRQRNDVYKFKTRGKNQKGVRASREDAHRLLEKNDWI